MSPQQHARQQHQQQHAAPAKKKKNTTRKSDVNGVGIGMGYEGAIAGGDASVSKQKQKSSEKKPLHTSMEQLQMQQQNSTVTTANRRSAGANWSSAAGIALPTEVGGSNNNSNRNSRRNSQVKPNDGTAADENESSGGANLENSGPAMPTTGQSKSARQRQKRKAALRNKYVAMDCEMVGVGFNGQDDMLARVSIVNKQGEVLLDKFVKPRETVTDYRTSVSGIRPGDIEHANEFIAVQDEVVDLLQGKILVGHGIRKDLAVLHIKHPFASIRDTSRYKPLCRLVANGRTPSLKRLSQAILGLEIQTGEHNSVEDARAAMNIYNRLSVDWEKYIHQRGHHKL